MYTKEKDNDLINVWYIVDPDGVIIVRICDEESVDILLSHLNR